MPTYEYKCPTCSENNKSDVFFEITCSINEHTGEATCPSCNNITNKRHFTSFAIQEGLTAVEKRAGTTKQRFDMGKYMKDARDKRKKQADPKSKDAVSNELWTGTEVQRGVIEGPEKKSVTRIGES